MLRIVSAFLLFGMTQPLLGNEVQVALFRKQDAAAPLPLQINLMDKAASVERLKEFPTPIEASLLPISNQPITTQFTWRVNRTSNKLTIQIQQAENLKFSVLLESSTTVNSMFGAIAPNSTRKAHGEISDLDEICLLIEGGDILIVLARPGMELPGISGIKLTAASQP